jgi:glucosamine-6-phosphate deaminase
MRVRIFDEKISMAGAAAEQAAAAIRHAIKERGQARIVAATGASQLEFLDALTQTQGIAWPKIEAFHLDEYIGLPATHPASFRKFLMERLARKTGIVNFHFIEGDAADPTAVAYEMGRKLGSSPIDVVFMGIGENGHIAFNDPPADFTTEVPYIIVNLDEACRRQQVGEGWFAEISRVPRRAISMSPRQILKARELIVIVPDQRKARAVKACLEAEISPQVPASILREHGNATLYLDADSALLLQPDLLSKLNQESQAMIDS